MCETHERSEGRRRNDTSRAPPSQKKETMTLLTCTDKRDTPAPTYLQITPPGSHNPPHCSWRERTQAGSITSQSTRAPPSKPAHPLHGRGSGAPTPRKNIARGRGVFRTDLLCDRLPRSKAAFMCIDCVSVGFGIQVVIRAVRKGGFFALRCEPSVWG